MTINLIIFDDTLSMDILLVYFKNIENNLIRYKNCQSLYLCF